MRQVGGSFKTPHNKIVMQETLKFNVRTFTVLFYKWVYYDND